MPPRAARRAAPCPAPAKTSMFRFSARPAGALLEDRSATISRAGVTSVPERVRMLGPEHDEPRLHLVRHLGRPARRPVHAGEVAASP